MQVKGMSVFVYFYISLKLGEYYILNAQNCVFTSPKVTKSFDYLLNVYFFAYIHARACVCSAV